VSACSVPYADACTASCTWLLTALVARTPVRGSDNRTSSIAPAVSNQNKTTYSGADLRTWTSFGRFTPFIDLAGCLAVACSSNPVHTAPANPVDAVALASSSTVEISSPGIHAFTHRHGAKVRCRLYWLCGVARTCTNPVEAATCNSSFEACQPAS
jgi:hypothetical protein